MPFNIDRRTVSFGLLSAAFAGVGSLSLPMRALAQQAEKPFPQWVRDFRARARERGVSDATYDSVLRGLKPDTSVYAHDRAQPEFTEKPWQYLNRRVSDWRISVGRERAQQYAGLFNRIENRIGVDRSVMLGYWGMESAFGDVLKSEDHMKPVFPSLAALAWGDKRRRKYWETELLNALVIVDRGWAKPEQMTGSWAGAMGHTQWMPEVWLNMGVDFDGDGKIFPYGRPDDALAGTANYLVKRGKYRRGEPWGYEVRLPAGFDRRLINNSKERLSLDQWSRLGITTIDGQSFRGLGDQARLWQPSEDGGPALLLMHNFYAVRRYNPSNNYALAVVHLGDRIMGGSPFVTPWPGGERALSIAELQELQTRLTYAGFDTSGTDGRVGPATMRAVRSFQQHTGINPADGYASLEVLSALRRIN